MSVFFFTEMALALHFVLPIGLAAHIPPSAGLSVCRVVYNEW